MIGTASYISVVGGLLVLTPVCTIARAIWICDQCHDRVSESYAHTLLNGALIMTGLLWLTIVGLAFTVGGVLAQLGILVTTKG